MKDTLPENLSSLYDHEEMLREKALSFINSDNQLKGQIEFIQESLNVIFDTTVYYANQNNDELAMQTLGIRLFNNICGSLKMLLSGYFQIAFSIQRDILEMGFLLDYFSIDQTRIVEWKNCSNTERNKKFNPAKIREALNKRDGREEQSKRNAIYKMFCEYASHASYPGLKLLAKDSLAQIGPFYDEKMLRNCLFELAKQTLASTNYYIRLIKPDSIELLGLHAQYLDISKSWLDKHKRNL